MKLLSFLTTIAFLLGTSSLAEAGKKNRSPAAAVRSFSATCELTISKLESFDLEKNEVSGEGVEKAEKRFYSDFTRFDAQVANSVFSLVKINKNEYQATIRNGEKNFVASNFSTLPAKLSLLDFEAKLFATLLCKID